MTTDEFDGIKKRLAKMQGRPLPWRLPDERQVIEDISGLVAEIERLEAAIRKHRDQRGDDRCWMDDEELYRALPEGYTPPARDSAVELEHCRRFIESRHNPATEYVSPEREIERLRAQLEAANDPVVDGKNQDWD